LGADPNTLIDENFVDAGTDVVIDLDPASLETSMEEQFAYNNTVPLPRYAATDDLDLGRVNTCGPSFTLNFYIIDDTGAKRTVAEAVYTKQ
jgi:hypothetical protein